MKPATIQLVCPRCQRKMRPAPLMVHATDVRRRTCPGCRRRWQIKITPQSHRDGRYVHVAEWIETPNNGDMR